MKGIEKPSEVKPYYRTLPFKVKKWKFFGVEGNYIYIAKKEPVEVTVRNTINTRAS